MKLSDLIMNLMPNNNEGPQVIIANKPFFPIPPRFFLILGGFFLLSFLGFLSFRLFFLKPAIEPQPSQIAEKPKIAIPCPADPPFCQQAQKVERDGKYLVLGAKVDPDSPIYAVFDGKVIKRGVTVAKNGGEEKFYQIMLVDDEKDLKAVYYLKKAAFIPRFVKKGDVIGLVDTESISYLNNYNLGFSLLAKNSQEVPVDEIEFR